MEVGASKPQRAEPPEPDASVWLERHGDYLFGFAMVRLRDRAQAEDLVQDTLLAALQGYAKFGGRSSERTWLVGILKHKIADHFRRTSREMRAPGVEGEIFEHPEYFRDSGEWVGHWTPEAAPSEWTDTPATELERAEFWRVFDACLAPLPERIATAFTLREIDGESTEAICEALGITTNNLWVMLHRARMHLRACIERNWFRGKRDTRA